jgi:(1->4)-alpha-D-glucan 1-alpha-D-glucosylmutase
MNNLLERQAYRLAHWRIASEEINYRRFFDINDLVSLRVELPHVFDQRHEAILELVRSGSVTGLRVDHVDGLYDPLEYLGRLQQASAASADPFYIVVEKILGRSECLPIEWPIAGTTGYDFLNVVNDLLIDAEGCDAIERWHREAAGSDLPFAELGYDCNRLVMRRLFAGEVERLTHELSEIAARHWTARDISVSELKRAIVEVAACLPVYRTYADDRGLDAQSRRILEETLHLAKQRMSTSVNIEAWNFLREVLLLDPPTYDPALGTAYLAFLRRWQQFTGPVMAKGLEDTAFYRDSSLLSRNEVGGDSLRTTPPRGPHDVHEFLAQRQRRHPHSQNATTTHDTKRSEDTRARIDVLSELSEQWTSICARWLKQNRALRSAVNGETVPSVDEEIRIYQTLLGTWPLDNANLANYAERVREFLRKACREAKLHSDWLSPNEPYEEALLHFATALIESDPKTPFARSFRALLRTVALHGAWNSLSQLLIKITAPGVPDFYQGMESWAFQMVDPDNRRPVDHAKHREMLAAIAGSRKAVRGLVRNWQDGRIKMFATATALNFRREHAGLFSDGDYIPLNVWGEKAESIFAFARRQESSWAIVIARRLTSRLATGWSDTALELPAGAPSHWHNVFTRSPVNGGRTMSIADALDGFPVGLLAASE